jgi:hypothetical protein
MSKRSLFGFIAEKHEFLRRLKVGDSIVHPLLQMSAGLAMQAMEQPQDNRLLLLMPNRWECARWMAALCTLEIMRGDYRRVVSNINFAPGQKVLLNGECVVEFESWDEEGGWIWLRPGSQGREANIRFNVPLSRSLHLQPVSAERRLTPYKKSLEVVNAACRDAREAPLDTILSTHARGNLSLFEHSLVLVSEVGKTRDFAQKNLVNGVRWADLFLWGRLSDGGRCETLLGEQIKAAPTCLVAKNLHGAGEWALNQSERCRGLLIDGATQATRQLGILDDRLLDRNVPVVVVADLRDGEELGALRERGFQVWRWHRDNLPGMDRVAKSGAPFSVLQQRLYNHAQQKTVPVTCAAARLDELCVVLRQLDRALDDEFPDWHSFMGEAFEILNALARLVAPPSAAWWSDFQARLAHLRHKGQSALLLPEAAREAVAKTLDLLEQMPSHDWQGDGSKCQALRALLPPETVTASGPNLTLPFEQNPEITAIVLPGTGEMRQANLWWKANLSRAQWKNVRLLSLADLLSSAASEEEWSHLIICGWLGKNRMATLLGSHLAPKISVLLYGFEARWFRGARRYWQALQNENDAPGASPAVEWSQWLGLPPGTLGVFAPPRDEDSAFIEKTPDELPQAASETDFWAFESKMASYRLARYAGRGLAREDTLPARVVAFSDGRWAFVTEFRRLWSVGELITGDAKSGVSRLRAEELKPGDWVLFRHSDRDLTREIADKILMWNKHPQARKIAALWHEALQVKYRELHGDISSLHTELREIGCTCHRATLRGWLFNEDTIGPRDRDDLLRIALVTGHRELENTLDDVSAAIGIVREAHAKAAGLIEKRLLSDLPRLMKNSDPQSGALQFVLDEFGQVSIVRVEEITSELQPRDARFCNRLLDDERRFMPNSDNGEGKTA